MIAYMFQKHPENFAFSTIYNFTVIYPLAYFLTVSIVFSVDKKTLQLNNIKTRIAMNVKISVLVVFIEAIIYLLLYNLHDCTFKFS